MRVLKLYNVNDFEQLERPDKYRGCTLNSPAQEILTDFNYNHPYVVESTTSAVETEAMMKRAHVRLKFVIDKEERFLGIITLTDLGQDNLQKYVDAGFELEDISAAQIMTPRSALKAFNYDELAESTICDVLTSLQMTNLHHCLVFDKSTRVIRGLLSASDFAKKLDIPLPSDEIPTFVTLYNILVERINTSKIKAG